MAIEAFEKGSIYRHDLPGASLDVEVLSIYHFDERGWKLKVRYRKRANNCLQLVDPRKTGNDAYVDKVTIKPEDFRYWTKIRGRA